MKSFFNHTLSHTALAALSALCSLGIMHGVVVDIKTIQRGNTTVRFLFDVHEGNNYGPGSNGSRIVTQVSRQQRATLTQLLQAEGDRRQLFLVEDSMATLPPRYTADNAPTLTACYHTSDIAGQQELPSMMLEIITQMGGDEFCQYLVKRVKDTAITQCEAQNIDARDHVTRLIPANTLLSLCDLLLNQERYHRNREELAVIQDELMGNKQEVYNALLSLLSRDDAITVTLAGSTQGIKKITIDAHEQLLHALEQAAYTVDDVDQVAMEAYINNTTGYIRQAIATLLQAEEYPDTYTLQEIMQVSVQAPQSPTPLSTEAHRHLSLLHQRLDQTFQPLCRLVELEGVASTLEACHRHQEPLAIYVVTGEGHADLMIERLCKSFKFAPLVAKKETCIATILTRPVVQHMIQNRCYDSAYIEKTRQKINKNHANLVHHLKGSTSSTHSNNGEPAAKRIRR